MIRSIFWICLSYYCLGRSIALSCVCDPAECETLTDNDCPDRAGTVWDPCGCCKLCARSENQPCGGPYGFFGSCAHDLECVVTDLTNENSGGVCTRVMNRSVSCVNYHVVAGCNIIDRACKCEQVSVCDSVDEDDGTHPTESEPVDGSPFNFVNRLECEMNLKVLLTHEIQDDKPGW
uniref:Cysteine-rich motor neuron 1 protein n=1 Tax=Cacopsylla melanoneura TaxID=428564 RepID=A0A8D9E1V0_9HEMI